MKRRTRECVASRVFLGITVPWDAEVTGNNVFCFFCRQRKRTLQRPSHAHPPITLRVGYEVYVVVFSIFSIRGI